MPLHPKRQWIDDIAGQRGESLLVADGFDDQIVGVTEVVGDARVVYDAEGIVEALVQRGLPWEEAQEYFEFNIAGAHGEGFPLYLTRCPEFPAATPSPPLGRRPPVRRAGSGRSGRRFM